MSITEISICLLAVSIIYVSFSILSPSTPFVKAFLTQHNASRGICFGASVVINDQGVMCASNLAAHLWIKVWIPVLSLLGSDGALVVFVPNRWPGYPRAVFGWLVGKG